MKRLSPIALSTIVTVAAVAAAVAVPAWTWLRVPLGLPLVVFLPGLGIVSAGRAFDDLDPLTRRALAAGISLALAVGLGFALDLSAGLTRVSWVLCLAGVTLAANAIAARRGTRPESAPALGLPRSLVAAMAAGALVLLLTVAVSARGSVTPSGGEIVQLWALPRSADRTDLEIGVANRLSSGTRFHLRVTRGHLVLADRDLDVPVGGSTTLLVNGPPSADGFPATRAVLTELETGSERSVAVWPAKTSVPATPTE